MTYQEPKPRSIRLDDDVYEALKNLPESPNKFLRKVLSASGAFDGDGNPDIGYGGKRQLIPEVVGVIEGNRVRAALRGTTSKADCVVELPPPHAEKLHKLAASTLDGLTDREKRIVLQSPLRRPLLKPKDRK